MPNLRSAVFCRSLTCLPMTFLAPVFARRGGATTTLSSCVRENLDQQLLGLDPSLRDTKTPGTWERHAKMLVRVADEYSTPSLRALGP